MSCTAGHDWSPQKNPILPTLKTEGTSQSLLIVNNLSEDFSMIHDLHSNPTIQNHIPMNPSDEFDSASCQGPNDLKRFNGFFYLVCSLNQQIHMFDEHSLAPKRIISLGNGINPMELAFLDPSHAYVSSFLKDKILALNPTHEPIQPRILEEIELGQLQLETLSQGPTRPRPSGLLLWNQKLYVTLSNLDQNFISGGPGYLAIINTETNTIEKILQTHGRNPVSIVHSELPTLTHLLFIINTGTYQTGKGFMGDGKIDIFDLKQEQIVHTIDIGGAPLEMKIAQNGLAYLSNSKEAKILKWDAVHHKILPSIALHSTICTEPLQYVSALEIEDELLYATEFNADCLFMIDRNSDLIKHEFKTGDGPDLMALW